MKKILTLILLFITIQGICQTDQNGNPVFNSITTSEDSINDYQLLSNYYTLKNNIDNKHTAVYITDKPTLNDVENAAINLPSDFFVVMKKQSMLNMVLIVNQPTRAYIIVNPATGKQEQIACSIDGDITENRANEMIKEAYDAKAKIEGSTLYFNNKKLAIISNAVIKKNILELIEKQNLSIGEPSNVKMLSKEELRKIVLTESKEGGQLDFFTEIKGHEYDGVQIKPGLFTTKLGIALYQWGRANFELGVNTVEDTLQFWTEYKGRQANEREKEYITEGFNKKLE